MAASGRQPPTTRPLIKPRPGVSRQTTGENKTFTGGLCYPPRGGAGPSFPGRPAPRLRTRLEL